MVNISVNETGTISVSISFSKFVNRASLTEMSEKFGFINPMEQLKQSILLELSGEIERELNKHASKIDSLQLLKG